MSFGGVATRASRPTVEEFLRDQPSVIAVCHPGWRGIRAATYGQADHVLEVPGITSPEHADRLVDFLGSRASATW